MNELRSPPKKTKNFHALLKRDYKSPPSDSSGCTSVIIVTFTLRLLNPKLVTDPLLKITLNAVQRSIKDRSLPTRFCAFGITEMWLGISNARKFCIFLRETRRQKGIHQILLQRFTGFTL